MGGGPQFKGIMAGLDTSSFRNANQKASPKQT